MASATPHSAAGKTVVVIDSGWSSAWNTGRLVYQQDFANGDSDARNPDANTHGALVTSSILQQAPDVGIIELKVMPDGSNTADATVIEKALQWVVANAKAYDIAGVNLSLAGGNAGAETTSLLSDELAALAGQKVLTAVAGGNAGNGGTSQDTSLFAADHNVICVSASDGSGGFPNWSQRSPAITDLCADGTDISLTNLAGQSFRANGSSFSAPQVTAAVALAQHDASALRGSGLTQEEFLSLAHSTGKAIGTSGYTELDTDALLAKLAQTHATPTTPTPTPVASTITVNAHGSASGGVNAHFKLLVDGTKIGEGVAGTATKPFTFTANLAADAGHKIQVQFDNDAVIGGQDRNLFVDGLTVNGHAIAPTDPSVTYDKGALDGRDVAAGQSGLWWNGTLVFNTGKDFYGHAAVAQVAQAGAAEADPLWLHQASLAQPGPAGTATDAGWADVHGHGSEGWADHAGWMPDQYWGESHGA